MRTNPCRTIEQATIAAMATRADGSRCVQPKIMSRLIFRLKVRVNPDQVILLNCCRNATIAYSLHRPNLREAAPAIAVLPMLLVLFGLIRLV